MSCAGEEEIKGKKKRNRHQLLCQADRKRSHEHIYFQLPAVTDQTRNDIVMDRGVYNAFDAVEGRKKKKKCTHCTRKKVMFHCARILPKEKGKPAKGLALVQIFSGE